MEKLIIAGGVPLDGEVNISGAKNAVLPILAATLLADDASLIGNIPHLHDVTYTMRLLRLMGVSIQLNERMRIAVNPSQISNFYAPYDLVKTMRASILVLGPLLSRYGKAVVSLPGGCSIGSRPINLHLLGLQQMGADIRVEGGYIHAHAKRLHGARLVMESSTVTGTENLMMAATLAHGTTVIENTAREPEVVDLARFLIKMGARIEGAGTNKIVIEGVDSLHGTEYNVLPDRIESGTYLVAGSITGGRVKIKNTMPNTIKTITDKLADAGVKISIGDNWVEADSRGQRLQAVDVHTAPYPGFPTDMQAQFTALNALSKGTSRITEAVFENRFMHVQELQRLGAMIDMRGGTIVVNGVSKLTAAPIIATDLRASASLVLAGLAAEGETVVDNIHHIDRGYETMEEKLAKVGARIKRVPYRPKR